MKIAVLFDVNVKLWLFVKIRNINNVKVKSSSARQFVRPSPDELTNKAQPPPFFYIFIDIDFVDVLLLEQDRELNFVTKLSPLCSLSSAEAYGVFVNSLDAVTRLNMRRSLFTPKLPDFVENQKKSVHTFWTHGLFEEFELFSSVAGKKKKLHLLFFGRQCILQKPLDSFSFLLKNQKTYSVSLFIPTQFAWMPAGVSQTNQEGENFAHDQNQGPVFGEKVPVYFGEIPFMTERGSFLINGASRVLVNQILRCPSVYFKVKIDPKNRRTYSASFLSEYGSWLRFETDPKNRVWFRIDKSQRFSIYILLKALGFPEKFLEFQLKNYPALEPSRIDYLGSKTDSFGESPAQAIQSLWQKMNPGRWNSLQGCYSYLYQKFFHPKRYSIGHAGRVRLNKKLGRRSSQAQITTLTPEDILLGLDLFLGCQYSEASLDDIDHLKNRRVRLPGELMQNQLRVGLNRVMQTAHEKLSKLELEFENRARRNQGLLAEVSQADPDTAFVMKDVLQTQLFVSAFRELFHTSQLSQYMDETNPLAEITHKRRLSSLGPGGIGRDQAGFAVREIHPSHFGRICPIETPEGQNAGLVGSLASFASLTPEGFLQSPYRQRLTDLQQQNSWFLFAADVEDEFTICSDMLNSQKPRTLSSSARPWQASASEAQSSRATPHLSAGDQALARPVRYKQEFLTLPEENIQFFGVSPIQMISCATSLIPFLEHDDANRALMGSNMQRQAVPCIFPEKAFVGTGVESQTARDSSGLVVASESGQIQSVNGNLIQMKYETNELGKVQASRLYPLQSFWRSNQNTCLRQLPSVSSKEWVQAGDLLADGSASFHGEIALGKNICVAYMPWEGYNFEDAIVINERLVREDVYTSIHIDRYDIETRDTDYGPEIITRHLDLDSDQFLQSRFEGNQDLANPADENGEVADPQHHLDETGVILPGTWVHEGDILVGRMTPIAPPKPTPEYRLLCAIFETKPRPARETSLRVPPGVHGRVLEVQESRSETGRKVQVFLAHTRRIQIGDKMSGRHGNKGIVSLILPPQDMPFLQDGNVVDILLNPLGVPSRMNVGQVLECLFGLGAKYLKQEYRLLAFDEMYGAEASRGLVYQKLFEAAEKTHHNWLFDPNHPGKMVLFDGQTGEPFCQPILVGYSYMFKLIHLVDEKIHARSTGPYSLVTQQPLGGRSKHGGQRLGEMEVWALEGFGAASILHEFLTLKSDDIDSRNTFLFHVMKRKYFPQERLRACLPESFRVLVHELQALCLSVYYNPDFRLSYPSTQSIQSALPTQSAR